MVKTVALFVSKQRVKLLEVGGAAAVVHGVADQFGSAWGWIVAGGFALVKALELDLLAPAGDGS